MGECSAVIATRNGTKTIQKTIDSLLQQTKMPKKIIVVDDASNDVLLNQILEVYNTKYPDLFIGYRNEQRQWLFNSRQIGSIYVETEYMFFLDDDDWVHEDYIDKMTCILDKNTNKSFCYCHPNYVYSGKDIRMQIVPEFNYEELLQRNYISYSSMIRTSAFRIVHGINSYLNNSWNHLAEYEMWLKLAELNNKNGGIRLPNNLFFYSKQNNQMSKHKRSRLDQMYQALSIHFQKDRHNHFLNLPNSNINRILFVCKGRDSLNPTLLSFSIYTWTKALEEFGEVFSFYFDIETQCFGKEIMLERLRDIIDKLNPNFIYHPTYKHEIPIETWKKITANTNAKTIAWMSDDSWRFDNYSSEYSKGFDYTVTTYDYRVADYKKIGYDNAIFAQWGANTQYFHPLLKDECKDIDILFVGQMYDKRAECINFLISQLGNTYNIECYGYGWKNGMLSFPEMCEKIRKAKIVINFSMGADGKPQIKLRNFEVTASRSLLLTEYNSDLDSYLKYGVDCLSFRNDAELVDRCKEVLEDPELLERITNNGYEKTINNHTWRNRFEYIFNMIHENKQKEVSIINKPIPTPDIFYQNHLKYKDIYEFICKIIIEEFNPSNIVDFGCGCGFLIDYFHNLTGNDIVGIEPNNVYSKYYNKSLLNNIIHEKIQNINLNKSYDMAVCMEVIEHIPEDFEELVLWKIKESFTNCLWWSSAVPGQGGEGHINLKSLSYWEGLFNKLGLFVDWELTYKIKTKMLQNHKLTLGFPWFRDNFLLIKKGEK